MNEKKACVEAVEVLYHYIDGDLTEDRRTLIRRHLDDCPPCLDAFDFEIELRAVVQQKCREHVPDGLKKRVFDALRNLHEVEAQRDL